jgi:hypothetical protein
VVLAAVIVLAAVAGAVGGVGTVTAANSSTTDARTDAGDSAPATVYLGERGIDLSGVPNAEATLIGTAGEAEGSVASVTLDDADITPSNGFETGAYRFSSHGDSNTVDLSVRDPTVNDVTIYRGSGTGGADITGSSLPIGETFTVEPEFNFGQAAPAEVVLKDATGQNITDSTLTSSDHWAVSSGDTLEFDTSGLSSGEYTVTVRGSDSYSSASGGQSATDFSDASMSATITLGDYDASVSMDEEQVRKDNTLNGTVTGLPRDYAIVRISTDALLDSVDVGDVSDGSGSDDVFVDSTDRQAIGAGSGHIAAEYWLGDDGEATFEIRSTPLAKGETVSVEAITYTDAGHVGDGSAFSDASEASTSFSICGAGVECPLGDAESKGIALGDLDGDGDLDAFVANHGANAVWFNAGDGTFTQGDQDLGDATSNAVALADIDADGDLDAFVANDGQNVLWVNDGTGQFSKSSQSDTLNSLGVAAGDVNGDQVADMVVASSSPNAVRVSQLDVSTGGGGGSNDASGLSDHWRSDEEQEQSGGATAGPTTSSGEPTVTSEPRETDAATATSPTTEAETATPTVTTSSAASETWTPTPTQAPGLGPIAAVLALLTVALVRRRR